MCRFGVSLEPPAGVLPRLEIKREFPPHHVYRGGDSPVPAVIVTGLTRSAARRESTSRWP
jgi:hypothetical protein